MTCHPRWTGWLLTLGIAAAVIGPTAGAAGSVIDDNAPNHAGICAGVAAGFVGTGSDSTDFDSDKQATGTDPDVSTSPSISATATQAPASGDGTADGTVTTFLTYGAPTGPAPHDEIRFTAAGTVSALTALNSAGNPADAVVTALGAVDFYFDPTFAGVPPDTIVGSLNLPALRTLATHETLLTLEVIRDPDTARATTLASRTAGDGATTVALAAGYAYRVQFRYEAVAPHGVDPPFSVDLTTTLVPEPHTALLLGLGAIPLLARRRTRVR